MAHLFEDVEEEKEAASKEDGWQRKEAEGVSDLRHSELKEIICARIFLEERKG